MRIFKKCFLCNILSVILMSCYKLELSQKQFGDIIILNVVTCGRT